MCYANLQDPFPLCSSNLFHSALDPGKTDITVPGYSILYRPPPVGGWLRLIPQGDLLLTGCLALSVLPLSLATIHAISLDLFIHIT